MNAYVAVLAITMTDEEIVNLIAEACEQFKQCKLTNTSVKDPLTAIAATAMILQMKQVTGGDPKEVFHFMQDMKETEKAYQFFNPEKS